MPVPSTALNMAPVDQNKAAAKDLMDKCARLTCLQPLNFMTRSAT